MKLEPGQWMGRAVGSLLLLLAIAYGARFIWDLLNPLVPVLVAILTVVIVLNLLFQRWRR